MKKLLRLAPTPRDCFALTTMSLLLLLCFQHPLHAQQKAAPEQRITYEARSLPLTEVLKQIRAISKVHLNYNTANVRSQDLITVSVKDVTLNDLLDKVLESTSLKYLVNANGVFIVIKDKEKENSTAPGNIAAQAYLLKGAVMDKDGRLLAGVSVLARKTKNGTITNNEGQFSVMVTEDDVLEFSSVGMKKKSVSVSGQKNIRVVMEIASQEISEVVVNGYQTINSKMATGAIFKLKQEDFFKPGVSSVDQMLVGKVPGLLVMQQSGSPNSTPKMRMRGTSTFVGNAAPIWVVDGLVREDPVSLTQSQINNTLNGNADDASLAIVGSAISGLNPNDIESITFLRDAAATAIYGVRAANGVIVVTTKRGKAGPIAVSYAASGSFQERPAYKRFRLMNSLERVEYSREAVQGGAANIQMVSNEVGYEGLLMKLMNREISEAEFNRMVGVLETRNTDWMDLLFRNQFDMNHFVSMSGGNGRSTYYSSFGFNDAKGAAVNDFKKTFTGNFRMTHQLGKSITIDFGLGGSFNKANGYYQSVNPMAYAISTSRTIDPAQMYPYKIGYLLGYSPNPTLKYNIFNEIAQTENTNNTRSLNADLNIGFRIAKGLEFKTLIGTQLSSSSSMLAAYDKSHAVSVLRGFDFDEAITVEQRKKSPLPYGGLADIRENKISTATIRNSLTYGLEIFKGRDFLTMQVGNEIMTNRTEGFRSIEPGYFPDRGKSFFYTMYNSGGGSLPNSVADHEAYINDELKNTLSTYGSISYRLLDKYVFSSTIRNDGSNRFGQYSNQRFLPNFVYSGRWDVSNERWMEKVRFVSGISLYASYGTAGTVVSEVSPSLIASYGNPPVDAASGEFVMFTKSLPYPDLRWEKTHQWDVGIGASFFERRVDLGLNFYYRKSVDLLSTRLLPHEFGVSSMTVNGGNMTNKGFDASLNVVPLRTKDMQLDMRMTFSKNLNRIQNTGDKPTYSDYIYGRAQVPGRALNSFWSYDFKGLDPYTGEPLYNTPGKAPAGAIVDPTSYLVYSGVLEPTFSSGVTANYRYKRFTVNMDFYLSLGNHQRLKYLYQGVLSEGVPDPISNLPSILTTRWRQPGDEAFTDIPAISKGRFSQRVAFPDHNFGSYPAYDFSDARVVDASFLRCRSLFFGYILPENIAKKIGAKGISFNLGVTDPFIFADKAFEGRDPESGPEGGTALPITKRWTFRISTNF